jgi:hypothetical protein
MQDLFEGNISHVGAKGNIVSFKYSSRNHAKKVQRSVYQFYQLFGELVCQSFYMSKWPALNPASVICQKFDH